MKLSTLIAAAVTLCAGQAALAQQPAPAAAPATAAAQDSATPGKKKQKGVKGAARKKAATKQAKAAKVPVDSEAKLDSIYDLRWPVKMPDPLPGSILPGKRIVAYYGNPLSKRMGVLGEYDPEQMLSMLDGEVKAWQQADPSTPVQPALHLMIAFCGARPGPDGKYRARMPDELVEREISADGYAALTQPIEKMTTIDAVLRPDVLTGKLVDGKTGAPIPNATVIAIPNPDSDAVAATRLENSADGSFKLDGLPEQGAIEVLAPGYRKAVIEIKPGSVPSEIKLEPFTTKALYVTAAVASNWDLLMKFFDTIDRTELNAIVIDLKSDLRDDLGVVYYDSQVPIVKQLGTARPHMDLKKILAEAKKRGIYTIARTHIFSHDNILAETKPEWAAKDKTTGGVFADYPGPGIHYDWLDPWNRNVWDYNIQIAVEAAHLGFDEINYDYIRFPSLEFAESDKDRLLLSRPDATSEEKYANIVELLKQSQQAINGAGAFLSVDVFGVAAWEPTDLIGQDIARMGQYTDYVCPMVYPSHFWAGAGGFDNPAKHPYEIIKQSLELGDKQMVGKRAKLRPWLQDFTLTWVPKDQIVEYGPAEVRAQIQAAEDNGATAGWQLYDSANQYTVEALNPQ